jgi:Na+-translocating ferredoxin:NAD+ oxidoreductase subunit C
MSPDFPVAYRAVIEYFERFVNHRYFHCRTHPYHIVPTSMAFKGGYQFRHFEGEAEPFLRDAPLPETVTVPGGVTPFIPLVGEGSRVLAGEPVADCGGLCSFPAPVSGIVAAAGETGVTITASGDPSFVPVPGHIRAPGNLDRTSLLRVFRESGCSLLFGGRFSGDSEFSTIRRIIVNAVHNSPFDQAWTPDIFDGGGRFSEGLQTLKLLFPESEIAVGVNRRNRAFFSARASGASVHVLSDRFPQEHPELLARDVYSIEPGSPAPSLLVIPFEEVIRIGECMFGGRPLIDRIVLVAGPGVSRPGWHRIRIGTPFAEIAKYLLKSDEFGPWRIIRGGILDGSAVSPSDEFFRVTDREITVIRECCERDLFRFVNPGFDYDSYSRLTVSSWFPFLNRRLDSGLHGGVRPCVQCNFCNEVCPFGIYPHLIWKKVTAGFTEESFRLLPHHCIGCGLCDYVCPSRIEISSAVKKACAECREKRSS